MKVIIELIDKYLGRGVAFALLCVLAGGAGVFYWNQYIMTKQAFAGERDGIIKQMILGDAVQNLNILNFKRSVIQQNKWIAEDKLEANPKSVKLQRRLTEVDNELMNTDVEIQATQQKIMEKK